MGRKEKKGLKKEDEKNRQKKQLTQKEKECTDQTGNLKKQTDTLNKIPKVKYNLLIIYLFYIGRKFSNNITYFTYSQ